MRKYQLNGIRIFCQPAGKSREWPILTIERPLKSTIEEEVSWKKTNELSKMRLAKWLAN
jgi:hypothetical protein